MDYAKQIQKLKVASERKEKRLLKRIELAVAKGVKIKDGAWVSKEKLRAQLKIKRIPVSKLRKKLDKVFAVWVKQRGSKDGQNMCVTCGRWFPIIELQNGHYISRKHTSTRWDERNCNPQCVTDNVFKHGAMPEYTLFLQEKYGVEIIAALVAQSKVLRKMTRNDYEELIQKYSYGK